MSKLNFQSAPGYDAWYNANYPKLRDYSIYSKGAAIWNAALSAPAVANVQNDSDCSTNNHGVPELLGPCDCSVANGAAELPPLPKASVTTDTHIDGKGHAAFTADQMLAYARAAIASIQQAAPNALLVAALKGLVSYCEDPAGMTVEIATDQNKLAEFVGALDTKRDELISQARAALASVPTAPEAT